MTGEATVVKNAGSHYLLSELPAWELFPAVLRGKVRWIYYDENGDVTDTFIVAPGSDLVGLSVPKGQWHSLECLESGTVILECKDGAYVPLGDEDVKDIRCGQ